MLRFPGIGHDPAVIMDGYRGTGNTRVAAIDGYRDTGDNYSLNFLETSHKVF
jgi:hypothetical protein